jgi:fucose permease
MIIDHVSEVDSVDLSLIAYLVGSVLFWPFTAGAIEVVFIW